jgi:hypothetical protein
MQGIGKIYEAYRDGTLDADDEVALAHSTADCGYRRLSEPLVNIRATLEQAESKGLVDTVSRHALIAALAQMPYAQRSYRQLASAARRAGMADTAVDALARFCAEHPVNQKREDAFRVLEALCARTFEPRPAVPTLSRTSFLHAWEFRCARTTTGDGAESVSDLATLRACQLFAGNYPALYRQMVLNRLALECVEQCGTPDHGDPADVAVSHGVHRGVYPPVTDGADLGFLRQWLTPAEDAALDPRERVVTFLVRSFRVSPGIVDDQGALTALRGQHALEAAQGLVKAADTMNKEVSRVHPHFTVASLSERRIAEWFAERWQTTVAELPMRALDRGLESVAALVAAARPFFLLAKYNPALVDIELTSR